MSETSSLTMLYHTLGFGSHNKRSKFLQCTVPCALFPVLFHNALELNGFLFGFEQSSPNCGMKQKLACFKKDKNWKVVSAYVFPSAIKTLDKVLSRQLTYLITAHLGAMCHRICHSIQQTT